MGVEINALEAVIDSSNTNAIEREGGGPEGDLPDGRGPVVLQVLPSLRGGGAERGAVDVAAAIVAAGGTALVASAGGPMVRELQRVGAQHIELPLDSKNPFVIHANARRLVRLIRRHRIDIIHARSRAPAWSAMIAARRTGCRFVTTFHGAYSLGSRLKHRYNAVMTKGDRVIAVSDFIADHIHAHYAVDPDRLRVIHRGVDLWLFDPERVTGHRVVQLAQQWRLPDGVPVVMLPGRLTRLKGHRVLIEALGRIRDRELVCVLVGSGHGRSAYRRELEELIGDLGTRVHFAETCGDMPAAYMLADVVISASVSPESFGRTIAEAQAMGCPVIASDHGGAHEQLAGAPMAWLVPPGDPDALADAIVAALDLSNEERATLARAAIANVRARFSNGVMCAKTLGVYWELLGAEQVQDERQ
jgi:glycosyltransferase involved in cell wall biosynthesis